ncbi:unnamed protein product [Dibothriocephalus latus]|uniref:Endonuclease/exonuclease/phosphatase domain-containing protein n=1 Tax=Dibothriocephalus latus TaxID=60516 RepID=A0A3P7LSL5_DIBLA|nr:unnamed protein product [Dibothriocephalus latus]
MPCINTISNTFISVVDLNVPLGSCDCLVRCGSCNGWCHLRCSGLANSDNWSPAFTWPSFPVPLPVPTPPALPVLNINTQVSDLATPPGFKILQFNANGLLGKLDQLLAFMRSHSIAVVDIQETMWTNSTKVPSCADYTIVRRDRGHNKSGGFLAFLMDKPIFHHQLAISLDNGPAPLIIVNVYIPPTSSYSPGFTASIAPYLPSGDNLVPGDFNAHHDM